MDNALPQPDVDSRSTQQVVTQFRKIQDLKRILIKDGIINGDATPAQVLAVLRIQIPQDLFL